MLIDKSLLDGICKRAKASERLRMNYNLHKSLNESVQRLINAVEPGTKLPIHRHREADETCIILRGCIDIIFYDDEAKETQRIHLNHESNVYGVHIPKGQWHSLESRQSDSALISIKEGPYKPICDKDILVK